MEDPSSPMSETSNKFSSPLKRKKVRYCGGSQKYATVGAKLTIPWKSHTVSVGLGVIRVLFSHPQTHAHSVHHPQCCTGDVAGFTPALNIVAQVGNAGINCYIHAYEDLVQDIYYRRSIVEQQALFQFSTWDRGLHCALAGDWVQILPHAFYLAQIPFFQKLGKGVNPMVLQKRETLMLFFKILVAPSLSWHCGQDKLCQLPKEMLC